MLVGSFNDVSPGALARTIWCLVAIAMVFVLIRTVINHLIKAPESRIRTKIISNALVYIALATLIVMAVLYRYIIPDMYEVDRVATHKESPSVNFIPDADFYLRCQFALIVLFWTSVWAVKFSILAFYKSLFHNLHTHMLKWAWWTVLAITGFFYLGCWGTQIASCWPIEDYFHIGKCLSPRDDRVSNDSLYITVVFDVVSDFIVMFLLLALLWDLKMDRKPKLAIAAIFCLSGIVVIFAIIRAIVISPQTGHVDPVWLALWSIIEASVAVVVACLPSFRILQSSVHGRSGSSYKRGYSSSAARSDHQGPTSQNRNNSIPLDAIHRGRFLDLELGDGISHELPRIQQRPGAPNTTISNNDRRESQEEIMSKDGITIKQEISTTTSTGEAA